MVEELSSAVLSHRRARVLNETIGPSVPVAHFEPTAAVPHLARAEVVLAPALLLATERVAAR
jgi:hypothetical protein